MNYDFCPIIVFTQYNFNQVREFHRYKMRRLRCLSLLICSILLAILLPYTIYGLITSYTPGVLPFGTTQVLFIIIYLVIILPVSNGTFYTRKIHEIETRLLSNGQTSSFRNGEYDLESQHADAKGSYTFSYDSLYRVAETKGMFYLYSSKDVATLIDKNGFHNGTPEELRDLLRNNLPARKCKSLLGGKSR